MNAPGVYSGRAHFAPPVGLGACFQRYEGHANHSMTSSNTPLLSVGMPVLNCATTLPQALRSFLGQTYPHWELWLLDDGSVDNTLAVARAFDDPRICIL